jgi:hypothetical protein
VVVRRFAVLWLALATPLSAQLAPVGAPKGVFRFELGGMFQSADRRLFDGRGEDYLSDFGSRGLGSDRLPFLRATDSLVGDVIGQSGYRVNLGGQVAQGQLTAGAGIIGGSLGLTRWLTLFARVPIVETRVRARLTLDSTVADAGFNPAHPTLGNGTDQGRAAQFFSDFSAALTALDARISSGAYAGNPALESLARALLAEGTAVRDDLARVTTDPSDASPFLPTGTSPAGLAVLARVRGLQDTLANTLGVGGFTGDPVLATGRLSSQDFAAFLSNPSGPIDALPLAQAKISRMGDMDVGAVLTLVDRFDRPGTTGGLRLAIEGLLRLPTGQLDDPNNLLDVGTGNGRYELGGTGTLDLGSGAWGARLQAGYLHRFTAARVRRVSLPSQPYAELLRLTNVEIDAGSVVSFGARPFFRLTRSLALTGAMDYWREARGSARYASAADSIPGVSAGDLVAQSRRSALALGGGISYVGRGVQECEPGHKCGLPIEASWSYTNVFTGSGGRVPQFRTTRLEIRWYQRLWH